MSKNTQIGELINYISVDGSGNIVFNTVSSATTNTDKFLVSDTGVLKFRTAAQLLSDIGAQASGSYQAALSGTGFVKISGSTISYDNSTYATQTYVTTAISNLVAAAPSTLDTLNELATALGNDANFATTVATSIGTKQAQLNGTGFVKISGTTISYDNSTYALDSAVVKLAGSQTITGVKTFTGAGNTFTQNTNFLDRIYLRSASTTDYTNLSGHTNQLLVGVIGATHILSFPENTNYTYTFPAASGTLAFTSNLSSYLPLAGGTITGPGLVIDRPSSSSGEPYLFFNKDGVNRASIYGGNGTAGLRFFSDVNTFYGNIIIDKGSPTIRLAGSAYGNSGAAIKFEGWSSGSGYSNWQIDTAFTGNNELNFVPSTTAGGSTFTTPVFKITAVGAGSFSSNLTVNGIYYVPNTSYFICGSSGGFRFNNSTDAYNNFIIYENGNNYTRGASIKTGAVRLNNGTGGSSPKLTFGTEDESVAGNKSIYLETYWMVIQPHVNEGLRIRFVNGAGSQTETVRFQSTQTSFYTSISSSGSISASSTISASGNMSARNFGNFVKSFSSNGYYNWADEFAGISGVFDTAGFYKGFIRESNGAHYYGYQFDINVGSIGYGGNSLQYVIRNLTAAHGPWPGGCGTNSFQSIDTGGFTKQNSGCFDSLHLYITKLSG